MNLDNISMYFKLNAPVVIYDLDFLLTHIEKLKKEVPNKIKVLYSVKANSNYKILKFLNNNEFISGFECASIQELNLIEKLTKKHISITGPSFSYNDIKDLYDNGYIYDFNSINQIKNLGGFLFDKSIGIRVMIDKSSLEYKNNNSSRFGITVNELMKDENIQYLNNNNIKIERIHFHSGEKDSKDIEKILNCVKFIYETELKKDIKSINLGGGWKFLSDKNRLNRELLNIIEEIDCDNYDIFIEPGSLIIDKCGYLLVEVIDIDKRQNHQSAVVNVSAHNLLTWFLTYPIANNGNNSKKYKTDLWGASCYEEDFFLKNHQMNEMFVGTKILFYPFGAYFKNNCKRLHDIEFPTEVYFYDGEFI
ncbi:TPA: hypothetical protein RJJ80_002184 [Staphylococcus pseudintermedius]|nr:hypothetical protein [Staphylococcus pseudintermedius]